MNIKKLLSEKEYQSFIISKLKDIGYEKWNANYYDDKFAIDRQQLFRFLWATQPDVMKELNKTYKGEVEDVIVAALNMEETKKRGSRLEVLKHGIDINNRHLDLLYTKPETTFNKTLNELYQKNIFSVMEEVWASDKERVDLVIFLNGIAIMTFELKANTAGQNYEDAMKQYRTDRNPKTKLFQFKSGALVHFAMDMEEVYMTTKLNKLSTFFLPFNMGTGTGIDSGSGNPIFEDKYSVFYMWENILKKDSIIEIITKFMFIESKEKTNSKTGKPEVVETVIFPRYHQLDVVRNICTDVKLHKAALNYLLQHSPGSGKTNEIAWTAYRLATLHDENNEVIFDNVIVCTDTIVVDRQLQQAILSLEHKSGFVQVMSDKCTSADLAKALERNTKIIVTTIQKFPYIVGSVKKMKNKKFAVIIDEAHCSTAGKNMAAVNQVLSTDDNMMSTDMEDLIVDEITRNGKQDNVSIFAFTATPKPTTLHLFGRLNRKGEREPFHIYSMKQAIEEGFILDVLQNYTTYETFYRLNKEIEDDPELKTNEAKRQINRFVELHDTNIAQRIEIIVEHFQHSVRNELNGTAKGMIVTESRMGAVKYKKAFDEYVKRKGYDLKALVAFSGKLTVDDVEYTEQSINNISEKNLPSEFDKDEYQILIVANKYQTGFDQKKLCAMYVLKTLHGITTVQTYSRLNRICPPYNKKTFILDFANSYESVVQDFQQYYVATSLSNSITPAAIYDLEAKLDNYYVLDQSDIEEFNKILYRTITTKDKRKIEYLLQKTKKTIDLTSDVETYNEIVKTIHSFIRFYEFLLQATCFEDVELHKKYNFLSYLSDYLKIQHSGNGFDLKGKIEATGFTQKQGKTYTETKIKGSSKKNLPVANQFVLTPDKTEKLSRIIAEINSKTGKAYDNDVAVKAMLQIKDIMMKSESLRASAKNNTERDFEFAYFDNVDEALIEGLSQNQDFFTLLLQNDEIKKEVLGIFANEVYKCLRA